MKSLETKNTVGWVEELLGTDTARDLLEHRSVKIPKEMLHLPGPDFVDRIFMQTDRPQPVINNLQRLFNSGRLAGSGYLSIFPVDQGIEHSAGASFAKNPIYFDPENIVRLAVEAGCSGVASTFGVLSSMSRKYAHKIPFVVKLNHNEFLSYPNAYDQVMFGSVEDAYNLGAAAVGATIYFGSEESRRQIVEVAEAFDRAHQLGMATILWCYTRNAGFKKDGTDYHGAMDLQSQATHLGVTIKADIIKQKLPELHDSGYLALNYGKIDKKVFTDMSTPHPIDMTRYMVANCYMGRAGLINSGGASAGESDMQDSVRTAIINKRAGGMGLILGRRAFQRPFEDGVKLLNAVQDVYLSDDITIA